MREIKFRAWDKNEKRMITFEELINRSSVMDFLDEYIEPFSEMVGEYKTDRVYLQYTGLKDKNGTEIYEGDVYKGSLGYIYEVEFDEPRCGFVPFAKDAGCGCCSDEVVAWGDDGEVIGNIYENSELLVIE